MKISYCICAHNEAAELEKLLRFLKDNIQEEDEIIIQLDSTYTPEVLEVCNLFTNFNHTGDIESQSIPNSKWYIFPLNNDFASFKNELINNVTGDVLVQLDADEIPHPYLIENLPTVIEENPEIDMFALPRENFTIGIEDKHLKEWGWNIDEKGRNCWPDLQMRVFRLNRGICWKNKLHEVLINYKTYTALPLDEKWSLNHTKTIQRQEKQNKFYETI
jgi:glycosyltransferase involved in cell wall biosynthesis